MVVKSLAQHKKEIYLRMIARIDMLQLGLDTVDLNALRRVIASELGVSTND